MSFLKRIRGVGQAEFILVVLFISVAAITAFKNFGSTSQHQVASLATALSGGGGSGSEEPRGRSLEEFTAFNPTRVMGSFPSEQASQQAPLPLPLPLPPLL